MVINGSLGRNGSEKLSNRRAGQERESADGVCSQVPLPVMLAMEVRNADRWD